MRITGIGMRRALVVVVEVDREAGDAVPPKSL